MCLLNKKLTLKSKTEQIYIKYINSIKLVSLVKIKSTIKFKN